MLHGEFRQLGRWAVARLRSSGAAHRAMDPTRLRRGFGGQVSSEERCSFHLRRGPPSRCEPQRRKDCRCRIAGAGFQPPSRRWTGSRKCKSVRSTPCQARNDVARGVQRQRKRSDGLQPFSPRHRRASVQREHTAGISDGGGWSAAPNGSSSGAWEGGLRENCELSAGTARARAAFGSDGPLEQGYHSSADTREFC